MNATINQNTAGVGELAAFPFKPLPLALPEPSDTLLARHGVEPWMIEEMDRNGSLTGPVIRFATEHGWLEAYARVKRAGNSFCEYIGHGHGYRTTEVWSRLYDISVPDARHYSSCQTGVSWMHALETVCARMVADQALSEREHQRQRAKDRRAAKKTEAERAVA